MNYAPIPEGATSLSLSYWGCGSECCDVYYMEVRAVVTANCHPQLWASTWFDGDFSREDREALREEVAQACQHYGIEADLSDDWPTFWEGKRTL